MFARQLISLLLSLSLVVAAPVGVTPNFTFIPLEAEAAQPTKAQIAEANATIKKACVDPKQVSYERSKNKGRTVYKPFLKTSKGKRYCSDFGIKDLKSLPLKNFDTEASDTANCKNCKTKTVKDQIVDLAAQAELGPTCKPDKQTPEQCTKDLLCIMTRDVLRIATPGVGEITQRLALPKCGTTRGDASCAAKIGAGVAHGIKDLVKGIWQLAKAGGKGIGKLAILGGKFVIATAKDKLGFFGNLFAGKQVFKTDNTMSLMLLTFQKISKSRFAEAVRNPGTFIKNFVKQIYFDALKTSKMMANCQQWKGLPLVSQCKTPVPAWACLNCGEKMQTVCGMLGFALTDIVAMFTAGVGLAKVAGRAGKGLSALAKATTKKSLKYLGKDTTRVIVTTTKVAGTAVVVVGSKTLKALALLEKIPGYKFADDWLMGGKALQAGLEVGTSITGKRAAAILAGSKGAKAEDIHALEDINELDISFTDTEVPTASIQSTKDYLKEVEASKPEIARTTREEHVKKYATHKTIDDIENLSYAKNVNAPKKKGTRVYVYRNSYMKQYNNIDFDRSTAMTTSYVERVNTKVADLAKKYEGQIEIKRYEGSNRLEVEVVPVNGKTLPKNFEAEMANIYKLATAEHHLFLKQNKIVRDVDEPINAFTFGSGPNAHAANLSVRANKNYQGSLATHAWESAPVQAALETVFMRAQDLHKVIKADYGKTPLFDQKTGRIDPAMADIISKADSPADLIKQIENHPKMAGVFKDAKGKPHPRDIQMARADELMEYIDYTKSFGVEFYGTLKKLEIKDENVTASSGADISGQNGRNISHNTIVFDSSFKNLEANSVRAEKAATEEFNKIIQAVVENRAKALKEAGITVDYIRSGDDVKSVFKDKDGLPIEELPTSAKRHIGNCNDGLVCLRDTVLPDHVQVKIDGEWETLPKQIVTDAAHDLEKATRKALREEAPGRYDERNFWVEVSSDGRMKLKMSYPPKATKAEIEKLKVYEEAAQAKFAAIVRSKTAEELKHLRLDEGSFLKHSMRPPRQAPTAQTFFGKPGAKAFDIDKEGTQLGLYLNQEKKLPEKMRPVGRVIHDKLTNAQSWSNYVVDLQSATRTKMLASKDPKVVKMAQSGELRRNEMLAVIIERGKKRGDNKVKTIKTEQGFVIDDEVFAGFVQSPFFDRSVAVGERSYSHGIDIHIIQRDYLADYIISELRKTNPSATQEDFYTELSKHPEMFGDLFDAADSVSAPENMRLILDDYLPLR